MRNRGERARIVKRLARAFNSWLLKQIILLLPVYIGKHIFKQKIVKVNFIKKKKKYGKKLQKTIIKYNKVFKNIYKNNFIKKKYL